MPRGVYERKRVDPTERFWLKVDSSGDCWLWTGAINDRGYGVFWVDGALVYAHRFSYSLASPIPPGLQVDHRHTCLKSCVNPSHLRLATNKQNNENQAGVRSDNTSGVRGVSWNRARSRWRGRVYHHGREVWLGYFDTLECAAEAVRLKRIELFTHNDTDREGIA